MFKFKFVQDNGNITIVQAKNRKSAIDDFKKQTNIPDEFIKKHIIIKRI